MEQDLKTKDFEISILEKENEIQILNAKREADIMLIRAKAKADSLKLTNSKLTTKYIQLNALENPHNRVIYIQPK